MLLFLALACSSKDADDDGATQSLPWLAPAEKGHFEAGVTTFEFVDERGIELTVEVWYPAAPVDGDLPDPYPEIPIARNAFRDAPAAGRDFPLVAFTHGHIAIRYQSAAMMEHIASHGFVIVSPDHPGDTFLDANPAELWDIVVERPADVINAVDEAIARTQAPDDVLSGVLSPDVDEYAVMGHSLGSINALLVGGAEPDWAFFDAFCDQADIDGIKYEACRRIGGDDDDGNPKVDPSDIEGRPINDPRTTVTIPMSPGAWYAFGDTGLHSVSNPLILAGDLDPILPYDTEARGVYENMAAPRVMATFENTGHYAFSDICTMLPVWDECEWEEGGWIDPEVAQGIANGMVTAWLRGQMVGDDEALEWLDAERDGWKEVLWEQEL